MKNIVLFGFMGCGKSTVGELLTKKLSRNISCRFVDMDGIIEQRMGMPVSEIFEKYGEQHFRLLETELAAELSEMCGLIISAGGGALLNSRTRAAFGETRLIFMDVSLDCAINRLLFDSSRPLLAAGAPGSSERRELIAGLYSERRPCYQAMTGHTVNADLPPDDVAEMIMSLCEAD